MVFLFNGKVKQKIHDVSQNNSKNSKEFIHQRRPSDVGRRTVVLCNKAAYLKQVDPNSS